MELIYHEVNSIHLRSTLSPKYYHMSDCAYDSIYELALIELCTNWS